MNQLVRLTTNDLSKAYSITDSLTVSEQFNKKHFTVLRDIRTLYSQLKESLPIEELGQYKIVSSNYITEQNKEVEKYDMNKRFFMMLVMGYNTKKAFIIKNEFIKQFEFMEHELIVRGETRHIGKAIRNDLTKAIVDNVPDNGNFKKFAISNYTKLIYKKVLGMTLKKYKELHDIPKGAKNRDFLNREQLEQVQIYESKIADIIEFSSNLMDEKELYGKVKIFVNKGYR